MIVMIQEPIKLAMPILQWNLSAAIEKWPDHTSIVVTPRNPTSWMAEIVITQWKPASLALVIHADSGPIDSPLKHLIRPLNFHTSTLTTHFGPLSEHIPSVG